MATKEASYVRITHVIDQLSPNLFLFIKNYFRLSGSISDVCCRQCTRRIVIVEHRGPRVLTHRRCSVCTYVHSPTHRRRVASTSDKAEHRRPENGMELYSSTKYTESILPPTPPPCSSACSDALCGHTQYF